MSDNQEFQKPLLDQIIDNLINSLERDENFDDEILAKLRELNMHGDFGRAAKLASVINPQGEIK